MNKKKGNIVSGFLYWLMALIIVALFIPAFLPILNIESSSNVCNDINGKIICLIIHYYPIPLVIMLIIMLFVIAKGTG